MSDDITKRPYARRMKLDRKTAKALRTLADLPMEEYVDTASVFSERPLQSPPPKSPLARLSRAGWLDVDDADGVHRVRLRPEVVGFADRALHRYDDRRGWFWDSVIVGAIAGLFE